MKKIILLIVGIIVGIALIAGGGWVIYYELAQPGASNSTSEAKLPDANFTACDILTQSVATALVGTNATKPTNVPDNTKSTTDVGESSCMYIAPANVKDPLAGSGVQLFARIPKTKKGATANIASFNNLLTNSQIVTGIGDKAFYNQEFKQLNILKGNNWYFVTYYVGSFTNVTLASDQQLATKLQLK